MSRPSGRLVEVARVRQHPGDHGRRRWFTSHLADLFVWEVGPGALARVEFYYDKWRAERVLAWDPDLGLRHGAVDDGEGHPLTNATPIVVPLEAVDGEAVALEFERLGAGIEPAVYRCVLARLHGARWRTPRGALGSVTWATGEDGEDGEDGRTAGDGPGPAGGGPGGTGAG